MSELKTKRYNTDVTPLSVVFIRFLQQYRGYLAKLLPRFEQPQWWHYELRDSINRFEIFDSIGEN